MKLKFLIFIFFLLIGGNSCAPIAEFGRYDVYSYHSFIYNENGITDTPLDILKEGESWVWRIGYIKRTYRPRRKFDYNSTIIIVGNYNYEYIYTIKGKLDIRNGTRCYHMRKNVDGEIKHYLIIGTKIFLI